MLVLVEGGKPESPEKNLRAGWEQTTNLIYIRYWVGIKRGPHWCEKEHSRHCPIPVPQEFNRVHFCVSICMYVLNVMADRYTANACT